MPRLTSRCACSRIAEEPKSRGFAGPSHGEANCELYQSGSFLFFYWLRAGRCARNLLQLICFRGYSLTAQTRPKCSARKCVRGDYFLMLCWYSLQHKQENLAPSSMKHARL